MPMLFTFLCRVVKIAYSQERCLQIDLTLLRLTFRERNISCASKSPYFAHVECYLPDCCCTDRPPWGFPLSEPNSTEDFSSISENHCISHKLQFSPQSKSTRSDRKTPSLSRICSNLLRQLPFFLLILRVSPGLDFGRSDFGFNNFRCIVCIVLYCVLTFVRWCFPHV